MAVDLAAGGRLIAGMARTQALRHAVHALVHGGMNVILPPHCGACDASVDVPGRLCADCWSKVGFIVAPYCAGCGTPFEIEAETGALCAACLRAPPAYRRARAAILYRSVGRDLILALKMADRTWIAPALGGWMASAGAELLRDADLIAPVPLHRWRLLSRRFNQSALLAATVSRESGTAWIADLLIRARATKSQARLSANERHKNVQGAFRLRKRHVKLVRGKSILLVDDVITTGATAEACVHTLLRSGAAAVDVLTLARTLDRST
ncbi:MAG: ComF family protein [Alphaproteobacteria bacterium]